MKIAGISIVKRGRRRVLGEPPFFMPLRELGHAQDGPVLLQQRLLLMEVPRRHGQVPRIVNRLTDVVVHEDNGAVAR